MGNIQKIKPSGIFTNYIFKSIPLAFDESLSYYEVLCGVLDLLKTQEEVINNNADLLAELEEYVKHYFDNLDVQEEINNKLDDMAEKGQLTDIIAQYLQLAGTLAYNNVNELKNAENLTNGSICLTLGYHNVNDGGSAKYKIRNIINTDVVDDMFILAIVNDDSLVAELIVDNYIYPEMLGAYGDGTHDDTLPLQKALSSGYSVSLTKNYLTTDTLNVGGYNEYVLNGEHSIIDYTGNESAILIQNINGGKIDFGRINALNGNCIEFNSSNGTSDRVIYTDLSFKMLRALDKCILIKNSNNGYVTQNTIRGGEMTRGNYGVYIESNPISQDYVSNALHFINMGFEGTTTNYYLNAVSQFIRGLTFTNDRFVENVTSTLFEIHGRVQRCKMETWSNLEESRLNLTDANLSKFEIICPIYSPGTTNIYADGIYFDSGVKRYIFKSTYSKVLTRNENVGGAITLRRMGNIIVVHFNDITVTSNLMDLVSENNNPYLPEGFTNGVLSSYNNNVSGRVWVRNNGSISFATSNYAGGVFSGELVYTTLGEEHNVE